MRKRILSILVYQCVVWLLFLLFANPYTTPVKHTFSAVSFSLFWVVSFVSIITYYVISSKVLSIGICTIKDVLVQIGFTLLFDLVIACIVVGVVLSTPKGPGYFDFRGVFELAFGIFNVISFSFATVIIAIIGVVKRKASPWAYKITLIGTVLLFVLCPLVYQGIGFYQGTQYERDFAQSRQEAEDDLIEMLMAKDASLPYQTNTTYSPPGLMDTGYSTNMVFIDYDTKKIGFLFGSSSGRYQSFSLSEGPLTANDYNIQREWDLDEPGSRLTTYYIEIDERNSHRTIAIQLEMADQSVYSIDGLEADSNGCFLDINLGPDD